MKNESGPGEVSAAARAFIRLVQIGIGIEAANKLARHVIEMASTSYNKTKDFEEKSNADPSRAWEVIDNNRNALVKIFLLRTKYIASGEAATDKEFFELLAELDDSQISSIAVATVLAGDFSTIDRLSECAVSRHMRSNPPDFIL